MRTSIALLLVVATAASAPRRTRGERARPDRRRLAPVPRRRDRRRALARAARRRPPRGSLTSSKDGKSSWEHLRIARDGDAWVYWASPMGRAPVAFRLVESAPGRAVFANPERPFPSRIVYWRDGADLLARIEGTAHDRAVAREWRYWPGTAADCR